MFNNQVYQFWGVIWAITAVAGAVLLLRRRWRWLLSVNLLVLAFVIFVLTPAYFLVDQARQLPKGIVCDRSHRNNKRRIDRDWF